MKTDSVLLYLTTLPLTIFIVQNSVISTVLLLLSTFDSLFAMLEAVEITVTSVC